MGLSEFLADRETPVTSIKINEKHSVDVFLPDREAMEAIRARVQGLITARKRVKGQAEPDVEDLAANGREMSEIVIDCVAACTRDEREGIVQLLGFADVVPGVNRLVLTALRVCNISEDVADADRTPLENLEQP